MMDLLGVKYLLLISSAIGRESDLLEDGNYELVYRDGTWWNWYRNKEYLSRTWFYPKAYVLPHEDAVLALMASSWFDARKVLLLEKDELRGAPSVVEELSVIDVDLNDIRASIGKITADPLCAAARSMLSEWGGRGSSLRYTVPGPEEAGRYLLLMQHTAAYRPTPLLQVAVENGNFRQETAPARMPGTSRWDCTKWRTAELGEIELGPGVNQITITSLEESLVNIYALRLVRLPQGKAPEVGSFSASQFVSTPNRISFAVRVPQDGFLLLNEVYYPGWEATVDGKPAEILRADGIFRCLFLSTGDHHIEFKFRPQHFAWGIAISLLTLASFLVLAVANWRSPDKSATRGDFPERQTKHVG
jgi:hypothetical protein